MKARLLILCAALSSIGFGQTAPATPAPINTPPVVYVSIDPTGSCVMNNQGSAPFFITINTNTGVTSRCLAGTWTSSVATTVINSIINAALQAGADIGAQINTSCALAAGQTVWVPKTSAASFSTTIAPATNIPCHIMFDQGTWTYTGSTNFLTYTGNNLVMEGGGSCNGQAAGATCVGGTQFVVTNTAANGINCNGCPGAVFARFTLVGPNSGTGIGVIHSGILATYQDVQVRAFGSDGFQINGTRANSNEFRLLNVTSMSNKGWGFNSFGSNCNAGLWVTHAGTNTLGNYQTACGSSNYFANSDGSVTGTGYTFLSGATGNFGTLYSESGNETTCCVFNSGASANHLTLTSQATRTDNGTNNEFTVSGGHFFPVASFANPGIAFEGDTTTGWAPNGAGVWVYNSTGTPQIQIDGARINQGNAKSYCWSSNANPTAAGCDTGLTREAANTIDLGNSFGGSTNGILHYATHELLEGTAPSGLASNDVCYADSTAHAIKCSYNNGSFFNLPLVGTANTWSANQSFNSGTLLPSAAAGTDLGSTSLPFGNLWLGTAATNNFKFAPAATAAARTITIPDPLANDTLTFLAATQTLTNKTLTSPIVSTSLTQPETTAPSASASNDICYGDSTAHSLKCSYNNGSFFNIPQSVQASLVFDGVYGTYRVTADQTITAGASLTNIPGLSWTFPANTALNVGFSCHLLYSQATAAASDSFGVQDVTVAPTNAMVKSQANTSATAFTAGNSPTITVNTATTVVTFTPSAATTIFNADIDGMIEQPSNASTSAFNVMAQFTTNNGTIKRGSFCRVF